MADDRKSAQDKKRGLIIAMTILVVVVAAAAIAYNALAPAASENIALKEEASSSMADEEASRVPDFTMTAADGSSVSIRQFEGKPSVLNFWASTCGPCQSEMPHFQAAFERYGDEVNFIMVDIPGFNGETVDRAKRFVADAGYAFPIYFDESGTASRLFGLTSIPRTYFLDAEGYLVVMGSGALSESALQQGLDMLGVS